MVVSERTIEDATTFAYDLLGRLAEPRVQITTDRLRAYRDAIGDVFHGRLHEHPGHGRLRRPRPPRDLHSYVERQNLTMRMSMRRFTRLTNGASKKVENRAHAGSLHYMHYNFARVHRSLRATSAQATGATDKRWSLTGIAGLLD